MKVLTSEGMRALDKLTIEEFGIPGVVLMENAGRAAAEEARKMLLERGRGRVAVFCGPGNNGGDGFVIARYLDSFGFDVVVIHIGELEKLRGDAKVNLDIALKLGIAVLQRPNREKTLEVIGWVELLVDALLGTGSSGAVRGEVADAVELIRTASLPVLAVDIPTGIDVDTGQFPGKAVKADVTVTFELPKVGLLQYPAAEYAGKLVVAPIGIPRMAVERIQAAAYVITSSEVALSIPKRSADSHKGTYGHLAVVAGSVGMSGAAVLCSLGGLKSGAGLVTALVPGSINAVIENRIVEVMSAAVPDSEGAFGEMSLETVLKKVQDKDACVIGPGLGRDRDTVDFVHQLIESVECPMVLDADALYAVSKDMSILKRTESHIVLTPHPGEMAMLMQTDIQSVQSNRLEAARSLSREYGVSVVLKGAGTVIADEDGERYICTIACPAMATGGVGDVLAGMLGGFLAQKLSVSDALSCAVYLHARAGELASADKGESSTTAGDVAEHIAEAFIATMKSYCVH